jgi:probable rRNA maturation factor
LQKVKKRLISPKKSKILVQNHHPSSGLPFNERSIKALVSRVFKSEKSKLNNLELNFVDDHRMKKINEQFLNHNYSTDIITFPYNKKKNELEAEIFISIDTVTKNAAYYEVSFEQELKRVIIHGCLHLAGYDDRTRKEKEFIRNRENLYLGVVRSQ